MLPKAVIWLEPTAVARAMEVGRETPDFYLAPPSPTGHECGIWKPYVIATAESGHDAAARITRARAQCDRYEPRIRQLKEQIRELERKRFDDVEIILKGGDV